MDKDIISLIEEKRSGFSKGQIRIAEYIGANSDKAAFMTAAKLGQKAEVSESTVVRFALELGFAGYPEMRRALQEMIRNRLTSVQRIEVAKNVMGSKDTLSSILASDTEKIMLTQNSVDRESFAKAVDTILAARHIYILGMRTSYVLAMFMGFYFNMMFDNVRVLHEDVSGEIFEQLLRIESDDVLIGISFPRYSKRTVKAVRYARDRGAQVISVTDTDTSPIAKLADICLLAKSDMVSFVDSLVAPLSLINALIVAVGTRTDEKLSDTFGALEQMWDAYEVYEKADG
ncbi:MAG: MurR/RpiR family transcriptional regulator [Oscillospiraceae bacterium]|nr:MurR/RpiR family transcriptional regulator [Oscillospiraceae bacterium]